MEELWKVIESKNNYEISSHGRIRNIKTGYISIGVDHQGYRRATFSSKPLLHVLVAEAFIGNKPSNNHSVDHINRIKYDNRLENLRWATQSEQSVNKDKYKRTGRPVIQLTLDDEFVKEFDTALEASQDLGISRSSIKDVCKKREIVKPNGNKYVRKTVGGFKWVYKNEYEELEDEEWRSTTIESVNISFSNMGRVKYLSGKITYGCKDKAGYYKFAVNDRKYTVHIYIAKLFIGNPPTPNHTVDHINRIKSDNNVQNLRWASKSEQNNNRVLSNVKAYNSRNVIQYDLNNKEVNRFKSIKEASSITHINISNIGAACRGIQNTSGGFIWKYL